VLPDLNLIQLFDFYLALTFIVSIGMRFHQYRALMGLVRSMPGRWPRLLQLICKHKGILVTPATLGPAALALGLWGIQVVASRWVWPEAGHPPFGLTLTRLLVMPAATALAFLFGVAMFLVDLYCTLVVGEVDREATEKYFDQAEYWLKTWTAPMVNVFTFGYINPRKMVASEVQNALENATLLLNNTLWWICLQTGLRVACGLTLWLTYAVSIR
jgi:hypothetical protein